MKKAFGHLIAEAMEADDYTVRGVVTLNDCQVRFAFHLEQIVQNGEVLHDTLHIPLDIVVSEEDAL